MNTKNLWIDESNATEWSQLCNREIANWLSVIAGENPNEAAFAKNLKISVELPTAKHAANAVKRNCTLTGKIHFRWVDQQKTMEVPMPFNGAFLFRRQGSARPLVSVWPNWLAERHTFRVVRPTAGSKRNCLEWRLGLPDGTWVGAPLQPLKGLNLKPGQKRKLLLRDCKYVGVPTDLPEWLQDCLSTFGPRPFGKKKGQQQPPKAVWEAINKLVLKQYENGGLPTATDEDDLEHLRLFTFPLWLRQKIANGLLEELLQKLKGSQRPPKLSPADWQKELHRREIQDVLLGIKAGGPDPAAKARNLILDAIEPLGEAISRAINSYHSDERADYVDPINPLDLAARITKVQRIHQRASQLEEKPAEFRQNHPSFKGRICPVESPESGMVGITVHLAAGAKVDAEGVIEKTIHPSESIGFGASLVPFLAHNDGARDMMGAKNLRQAIPVREASTPAVLTGREAAVIEFVKPLIELDLCPATTDSEGRFCAGCDLLAAYMPWYGMNMEDAVVLSESAALKLGSDGLRKPPKRVDVKVGWAPAAPERPNDFPDLDETGLVKPGTRLHYGSPIAYTVWEGKDAKGRSSKEKTISVIRYEERTPAVVKRIEWKRRYEHMRGVLEYELELPIPIRPGDKLMGRHGNKGVVGTVLPDDQMPRLPDNIKPEEFRGRRIEILLNPHGVVGRMNIGQLIETQLGWMLHTKTAAVQDLCKDNSQSADKDTLGWMEGSTTAARKNAPALPPFPPAFPFAQSLDPAKMSAAMESSGLDRYGRAQLTLPGGKPTAGFVTVGFQHIVRLRHIPELKSQARQGGEDALYSARTGQAVRGRKNAGGQRIGEMEIWALSGHQADAVLNEILGIKSSGELIAQGKAIAPDGYSGYSQFFRDWLFAMGIKVEATDQQVGFSFLTDAGISDRIPSESKVTSAAPVQSKPTAVFECPKGSKHKRCGFRFLDGEALAFSASRKSAKVGLNLGDVLRHLHLAPAGKLVPAGSGSFKLSLTDLRTKKPASDLSFTFDTSGTDFIKGGATFAAPGAGAPASAEAVEGLAKALATPEWAKRSERSLPEIHLWGRFRNSKTKGNWSPVDLLDQFQRDEPSEWSKPTKWRCRCVLDLQVTCEKPEDSSSKLAGIRPFSETLFTDAGGLHDPRIFGNHQQAFQNTHRWGYIELPFPVKYPLHVFLTNSWKEADQVKVVKEHLDDLKVRKITPPELPEWSSVPVLPARYRMPSRSKGRIVSDDLDTKGYIPLIEACRNYRKIEASKPSNPTREAKEKWEKALKRAKTTVEEQLARIIRHLSNALGKKNGAIRQDGLGRRVDRSARLVITPNPKLDWDQVGVPATVLYELIGDKVRTWRESQSGDLPKAPTTDWHQLPEREEAMEAVMKLLRAYLDAHKDFVVLLNRQPSLHRDSFQAFKPVPLTLKAGDVIQLCPLACKGFAADFDGDEMVIHVPVSDAAQADARRMLPSQNLFSLATVPRYKNAKGKMERGENILAHFDQDSVMGTWFLGKADPFQLRDSFVACMPDGRAKKLAKAWRSYPTKSDIGNLLAVIAVKHPGEAAGIIKAWMTVALEAVTRAGVSFGYLELLEVADGIRSDIRTELDEWDKLPSIADINTPLGDKAKGALESLLSAHDPKAPGYGFAAVAVSGAKGKPDHLRQILGARGFLEPGKTGFDLNASPGAKRFLIEENLMRGLEFEEFFWAAMNARSSMIDKKLGTGHAGGLTRSMVFALWPHRVTTEDCESTADPRTPATCRVKGGVCAKCYGALPDGSLPPNGFPAGLIAAQSIGERGTQLSMKSVQMATKAIDISAAKSAIRNAGRKFRKEEQFLEYLQSASAYEKLLDRHFSMLWKVMALYDLQLMSVAKPDDLPETGFSQVVVALADGKLHIRIFDNAGQEVVDKVETEIPSGKDLTSLKDFLKKKPFPNAAKLPQTKKREIIKAATIVSGYNLPEVESEDAGTLSHAITSQDSLNLLGYKHTPEQFIEIVITGRKASRTEPIARLLIGKPNTQPQKEN
jgi:hypothetical protein